MKPGDRAELRRVFTAAEIEAFAPGATSVPEPLIAALFSRLLGMELPGAGTNYLKQRLDFHAPVPPGVALRARVEITRLRPEKGLVDLATRCWREDGTPVCDGRALVLFAP